MPVRITAKEEGFRRCGVAHPATPTDHPDDRFSPFELAVLQREPMLTVEIVGEQFIAPSPATLNVPQTVELVNAATSLEALNALAEGETRKGVLDAIAKRRVALSVPSEPSDLSDGSDTSDSSDEPGAPEESETRPA